MISIVIADDHAIFREGVRLILEADPAMHVVGEARDGLEAVQLAVSLSPDVLLLDLQMPKLDGVEACVRIGRLAPTVKVVVVSQRDSHRQLEQVLQAGAMGFVLKQQAFDELLQAIRIVKEGNVYLGPALTTLFVRRHFEEKTQRADRSKQLSDRETEVLKLVASGISSHQIAERLSLSIKTVQSHRGNIMGKLGLHDRVDLVKYAMRVGLIDEVELGSSDTVQGD